jgi:hypothetical protein
MSLQQLHSFYNEDLNDGIWQYVCALLDEIPESDDRNRLERYLQAVCDAYETTGEDGLFRDSDSNIPQSHSNFQTLRYSASDNPTMRTDDGWSGLLATVPAIVHLMVWQPHLKALAEEVVDAHSAARISVLTGERSSSLRLATVGC